MSMRLIKWDLPSRSSIIVPAGRVKMTKQVDFLFGIVGEGAIGPMAKPAVIVQRLGGPAE
jgi:hypothetical protein